MFPSGFKEVEYEDMPTYSYRCEKCEVEFDKFCKMDDRKIAEKEPCPSCKAEGVVHQFLRAAPGLAAETGGSLKRAGSGWGEVLSKIKEKHVINNIRD